MVTFIFPYLTKMPSLECLKNGVWNHCEAKEYCSTFYLDRRIDYDSPLTYKNWVTELNLICHSNKEFGLIGSLIFVGGVVGSTFITPLGDSIGRKPLLIVV